MCGIVGIVGVAPAAERIIAALKRLEYRGYDSAGIATLGADGIERRRAAGKIANLAAVLETEPLPGNSGIGHTRWATHGKPTTENAHPHATEKVAIVHNGIIENFRDLRARLIGRGRNFGSDTDSEVIAHLITAHMDDGAAPIAAAEAAVAELEGAFAIACIFSGNDDLMFGARRGSPLVVGVGEGEMFLGSDAFALFPFTDRVIYLDEGDSVALSRDTALVKDRTGQAVARPIVTVQGAAAAEKGNYRHFMLKEIHEQPETIGRTIAALIDTAGERVHAPEFPNVHLDRISQLTLVACGTAHYACRIAEYWLEQIALVPAECDIASEFRYRAAISGPDSAALFVSQSGETADTLAALRHVREAGRKALSVLNVPQSSMWRETDAVLPTHAGPEIGVASTKAFTAQLTALAAFAIALGRARGTVSAESEAALCRALIASPRAVAEMLREERHIADLAAGLSRAKGVLFLGRGAFYPLALEGALKLKEITYIHAEGCAAGELKHGPIALVDENIPVIVLAPKDHLFDKTLSNVEEVAARGGRIILISDAPGHAASAGLLAQRITVPTCHPLIAPIVAAIPVQLIAYYTAVHLGTDVDQPRNLAKSVTVE